MVTVDIYRPRPANVDLERGLRNQTNSQVLTLTKLADLEGLDFEDEIAIHDTDKNSVAVSAKDPYLEPGKRVLGIDGEAGKVIRILKGPDGAITHFVLSPSRWLEWREVLVPVEWVRGEDPDGIRLSVSRSQLRQQPEYRADFALADEIHQTLWQHRSLRITAEGIAISVRDAVVTLKGHSSRAVSARLEETIRTIPGVIAVQNAVISDDELLVLVLQTIRDDERLQGERIRAAVQQGVVSLSGSVRRASIARAAERVAAAIPQVRGVASYLKIDGHDTPEPVVVQPQVGQDVFAKGKPVGKVSRVIINPDNRLTTRFVLQGETSISSTSWLIPAPELWEVVVPVGLIEWVTDGGVLLKASAEEVRQLPAFNISGFRVPSPEWLPPFPYSSSDVLLEPRRD